jgi:hypothetical protein
MGWTGNYALYPADRLLVRTGVRMTLSAPPNGSAFSTEGPPRRRLDSTRCFCGGIDSSNGMFTSVNGV